MLFLTLGLTDGDKPLMKITEQHNDAALKGTVLLNCTWRCSHMSLNMVNGLWLRPQAYGILYSAEWSGVEWSGVEWSKTKKANRQ